jgi:hypothetical protein
VNLIEIHNLSAAEKFKIIEALWGDWVGDESSLPDPAWHETELKETEEKYLAGSIEVLDWQQAKKELRSQLEQKPKFSVLQP